MLGLIAVTIFLGFSFTFIALVVYTVVEAFLSPLMNVSTHVIDLNSMEIGRTETDFYATMILRDFILWICRSLGVLVLLVVVTSATTHESGLSHALYLHAGAFVLTFVGAYLLVTWSRSQAMI